MRATVVLTHKKDTPGTHVYENPDSTVFANVYAKKSGWRNGDKAKKYLVLTAYDTDDLPQDVKEIG